MIWKIPALKAGIFFIQNLNVNLFKQIRFEMDRIDFLKLLALSPLVACNMKLKDFEKEIKSTLPSTAKQPALFIGHGSPTNAIEDNPFTRTLTALGTKFTGDFKPKAILVVSAHWLSRGTFVSTVEKPETIYDFGGFQDELYQVKYPAPGSPSVAKEVMTAIPEVKENTTWGLDHGAWTILKHIFPAADIPVFQLSIDYYQPLQYHFDLAKKLASFRDKGVLIIGSGNIVHNLGLSMPKFMTNDKTAFDWAIEFDTYIQKQIIENNSNNLINYQNAGSSATLAVPTTDHYIPLLYAQALRGEKENTSTIYEEVFYGGLSMRSYGIGMPG